MQVCLAGECVAESAVPVPVDGGWSEWTESPCSRTCGGGVIIRERACNNPSPVWGGAFCEGEGFDPRLCNTDVRNLLLATFSFYLMHYSAKFVTNLT